MKMLPKKKLEQPTQKLVSKSNIKSVVYRLFIAIK